MLLLCLLFAAPLAAESGAAVDNLGPEFENRYEAYVPINGKTINWGATCPYVPQANKPLPAFAYELPIRPELLPKAASAYDWGSTCSLKGLEYLVVPNGTYTLAERRADLPAQFEPGCDASLSRKACIALLPAWIIAVIYMFYMMAVTCDEYLVPSLNVLCERTGIPDDVAGATLMAAGCNGPELFSVIVSTFIVPSAVGPGAILGSAPFNLMIILAAASFAIGGMNPDPVLMAREITSLAVATSTLVFVLRDNVVVWWEALLMVVLYVGYVLLVVYTKKIRVWYADRKAKGVIKADALEHLDVEASAAAIAKTAATPLSPTLEVKEPEVSIGDELGRRLHGPRRDSRTLFANRAGETDPTGIFGRSRNNSVVLSRSRGNSVEPHQPGTDAEHLGRARQKTVPDLAHVEEARAAELVAIQAEADAKATEAAAVPEQAEAQEHAEAQGHAEAHEHVWYAVGDGMVGKISWLLTVWVKGALHYTIPNPLDPKQSKFYLLALGLSTAWLAAQAYVMTISLNYFGCAIGISQIVIGNTIGAIGTSFPNMVASVITARQGFAGMSACQAIGANTFNILIALGLMWFIQTIAGQCLYGPRSTVSSYCAGCFMPVGYDISCPRSAGVQFLGTPGSILGSCLVVFTNLGLLTIALIAGRGKITIRWSIVFCIWYLIWFIYQFLSATGAIGVLCVATDVCI